MLRRKREKRKGIIFTLDGAIAISIVVITLLNTTYYFATTSKESISQTQLIKRGQDALAMFDSSTNSLGIREFENTMINFDPSTVHITENGPFDSPAGNGLNISRYLPTGYDMLLQLYDANKTLCSGGCVVNHGNTGSFEINELKQAGSLYVQVNFNPQGNSRPRLILEAIERNGLPDIPINVKFINVSEAECQDPCTLTTELPIDFVNSSGAPLIGQINGAPLSIRLDNNGIPGSNYAINWIKVLDDPAYMVTTDPQIHSTINTSFIGVGERWYAANGANGVFEGFHKVRFKIWLA